MKQIGCGDLRASDDGKTVSLSGWVHTIREHGDAFFIDIRDVSGITQCLFKKSKMDDAKLAEMTKLSRESVITVHGKVVKRPSGTENKKLLTGEIEVQVDRIDVLNKAEPLPYHFKDAEKSDPSIRLRYRYIDLRNPDLQRILKIRSKIYGEVRKYFESKNFYEIETPMLTKSTPEGARDYLVPSRVHKGKFYALPQSPQLYKQMLMMSGMERYYQIARCFRDEDLRPDRQPEFTQIDIEMSFIDREDIITLIEGLLSHLWDSILGIKIKTPFPRMSYKEAMDRYGCDKPDTRFGMELKELTDIIPKDIEIFKSIFENKGIIKAIKVDGQGAMSKKTIEKWRRFIRTFKAKDLGIISIKGSEVSTPLSRYTTPEVIQKIVARMDAKDGDLICFIGGEPAIVNRSLSELRLALAKELNLIPKDKFNFLWVIDFPLFEWDEEEKRWVAMHHPFTSCKKEFLDTFDTDQGSAIANAYDIVLNGYELGGGSIRIHNPEVQERMFKALGIPPEIAQINFSFLIEALKYGAPPHGGLAIGLDRLTMLMAGTENIQDVIAFPKTRAAVLLLGDAPNVVTNEQLEILGIELTEETKELLRKEKEEGKKDDSESENKKEEESE
jgi:aspartyl-tRNA synthetase